MQLNWHKDDREGRFLFRRMDEKSRLPSLQGESLRFGRKLSKREKRDKKKRDKKEAVREGEGRGAQASTPVGPCRLRGLSQYRLEGKVCAQHR